MKSPTPTPSQHTPLGTPPAYKRVEHKDKSSSSSSNRPESQNQKSSIKSVSMLGASPRSDDKPKQPRVAMPTGKTEESKSEKKKFSMRKEKKAAAPLPDYLARHLTPSPDYPFLTSPAKTTLDYPLLRTTPPKTTTPDYPLLPPRTTPSPDYLGNRTIPSPDYLSSRYCQLNRILKIY